MNLIVFILECYFAAMLGVSGLAKAEQPERFATTLYRHGILPRRSVPAISHVFPWVEVALAGLLVTGVTAVAALLGALLLFATFGIIEAMLIVTRRATECGCFGVAYPRRVDRASVAASAILVLLASAGLLLAEHTTPVIWYWHLGSTVLFAVGAGWLGWRVFMQHRSHRSWQRQGAPGSLLAPPTV